MRKIKNRLVGTKRYLLKILGISFVISSAVLLLATASWACTISGYVRLNSSTGPGLAGVTMSGLPGNPVTRAGDGYYSGTVTIGRTYTVTPMKTGYNFNPTSMTYTNIQTSKSNQIYIATLKTFTINASAGPGGSINPSGAVSVNYGESKTFTIAPNIGYHIVDVLVDTVSKGAISSYTFTNVKEPHTIAATFAIDTFTIAASAGPGGSINPSGNVIVNYGDSPAFSISPNTGYHIADVLVDNVSKGPISSYTFPNVTAPHTIAASFAIDTFTITASAGAGGSITPTGTVTVNYGGSQTFTIAPINSCYYIKDVLVDGISVGPVGSYPFTNVTGNHTIAASFDIYTYTITATAGNGGNIDPSGAVQVNCGADQTFTITPKNIGYQILDVKVDNVSQGPISSYTFTYVIDNHTIDATFIPIAITTMRQETVEGIEICTAEPDPSSGCPQLVYSCLDVTDVWVRRAFSQIEAGIGSIEWIGTGPDTLCPPVDLVIKGSTCVTRCYPSGYCYVGPRGCTESGGSTAQTGSLMTATVEQTPWVATTTLRQETIAGIEVCSELIEGSLCPTLVYSCLNPSYPACSCPEGSRDIWYTAQFSEIRVVPTHLEWVGIGPDPVCPTVDIVTGSTTKCVKRCYPSGYCVVGPTGCTP